MSERARDRLRRLLRDAPSPAPSPASEERGERGERGERVDAASARERLARRGARARSAAGDGDAARTASADAAPGADRDDAGSRRRAGLPAGLAVGAADGAPLHARSTLCAPDAAQGALRLAEVRHVDARAFELLAGDAALAGLDLERAVFLDTETSGLAGGSGTWVFLVGLGRFAAQPSGDARFEVWQGFLADPAHERALLAETAERVRAASGVVSFFGKSFDRHRLEDRMRMHRVTPPFAERPHLDLYHPLRRLYGASLSDVRLRTVERELLGFERVDDLPGAFAPEAWFDFLADRPHRLEAVFEHNLHDVVSLAALAAHLGRTLVERRACGAPLAGPAAARAHALVRTLFDGGLREEALAWIPIARERAPSRALDLLEADALRLVGEWRRAWDRYAAIAAAASDGHAARAWQELAKLAEHRRRDTAEALACCERAAALLTRLPATDAWRLERDLTARRRRLASKQDTARA